ncbi:type I DNA topoisomerase [Marispirochaeta sp.]|jgi:DNA topoisomerase I|uniref:type I DNA topoisomerase n=1 Tax=Marispirochaeta sp. TaxID=2038653 RepID=UPI0029C8F25D|nr:type I DNA topoisomerase [Marispirochaeta sp.]
MAKSLVIVESPAKAKTINKYLGKDFVVKSSVGHIRDLPVSGKNGGKTMDPRERAKLAAKTRKLSPEEKEEYRRQRAKEQSISRMGIDPENGWTARYEILPGKEKVLKELKTQAEKSDTIYLATDLDREGEAIAWHLMKALDIDEDRFKRVVFNEITKTAITGAFKNPGVVDISRVEAQQTRRFLDRVVGFMISPLLWAKVARGLSAGRVQSVAVRLVVEREREIRSFIPEEYWEVFADLLRNTSAEEARFQVVRREGRNFRPGSKTETDKALALLKQADYVVESRQDKPTKSRPKPPFITSTLQQAASTRLGFSVKKTMMLAQRLYEAGYITYMRTDSTALSAEALNMCRAYVEEKYGSSYLPEKPNIYASGEQAQEAHEAIRPSDVKIRTGHLTGIDADGVRLYDLIWQRFVASQMPPAEYLSSTITVKAGDFELRTKGRVILFDGYLKVLPPQGKSDEDIVLPDLKEGEHLNLKKLDPSQHFTKPSPRYTEASLVKELEKRGIGRPSTYAAIISTIQDRGYVTLENRRFYAQKIGDIVTDRLVENFEDLLDYNFTAAMEETLDEIAAGHKNWRNVLDKFYAGFRDKLSEAYSEKSGMRPNTPTDTDIPCLACGRNMQIRTGGTGVFLGCSGYNLPPKERCKQTMNLIPGEEVVHADTDDEEEARLLSQRHRCPLCGTAMDSYLIDEGRKLHICGNNPDCPGFEVELGKFKIKGYDGPTLECDKCGAEMQLKTGRFGKFFACTNEECTNTRKLLRNGEPAPPKMDPVPMPELKCEKVDDHYLLRDGAAGLFLAASKFPKNRETRAPLVEEILPHIDEIDSKYSCFVNAPTEDPDGNKAIIRFSRKEKIHYLMSEKDSKATGWRAYYRDGRWQREEKKAPARTAKKTSKKKSTTKRSST